VFLYKPFFFYFKGCHDDQSPFFFILVGAVYTGKLKLDHTKLFDFIFAGLFLLFIRNTIFLFSRSFKRKALRTAGTSPPSPFWFWFNNNNQKFLGVNEFRFYVD
jgi:hypothetical protein